MALVSEPVALPIESKALLRAVLEQATTLMVNADMQFGTFATGNVRRLSDGTLLAYTIMLVRPEAIPNG